MQELRVGSLFSGIGGIELGLERAGGFESIWFVESDRHAQALLRNHWPDATIHDDVAKVDFGSLPPVDVLTGGFPCQDISNAGKRVGITGNRSGLWKHYLRAISALRPELVIAENVAALRGRGLDTVLCDLAALGYDAEWHCVPAASVGAPHRRDRIFILAYPNRLRQQRESGVESSQGCDRHQINPAQSEGRLVAYTAGKRCGETRKLRPEQSEEWTTSRSTTLADAQVLGRQDVHESRRESLALRSSQDVADATSERGGEESDRGINESSVGDPHGERLPGCGSESAGTHRQQGGRAVSAAGWWATEPDVGRVAHGVPLRVDRIKRLGNGVVPAVAQAIGQAINEIRTGE